MSEKRSGFTIPGEAGYEKLTLQLAEKWGADVIRDSDGTKLSDEILNAGYGIYSTICIIRDHNDWAHQNMTRLQGTFLMTLPLTAVAGNLIIYLMQDFFEEQFCINDSEESISCWQVYDRTMGKEIEREKWRYLGDKQCVIIEEVCKWHEYTVSFFAYRIWEEISMYNHITNNWEKEHLMPIDPVYPETQEYLLDWLKKWCENHPDTTVVRFTSMFYNFVWIWGSSAQNRNLFTDWASYDFTVSPYALKMFSDKYGYKLTAEDFINKGNLQATHMPASKKKRDWMEFINDFVLSFGRQLVDIVHGYGKKAYVFYDDSWVGLEPYNGKFEQFGFDGIIKAVFSAFEARLCSGVPVRTHELRLHPYLFPTGVDGSPSFLADGNPTAEARKYWMDIRRALLRVPVDRLGLGGYLHLVERKPEFEKYISKLTNEFRQICDLHSEGSPWKYRPRIGVLHYWGKLRSWTLSGHLHETYMHDLIHVNECLAGMPFEVRFLDFNDIRSGALRDIDVIINAGYAGSAWSGGLEWTDEAVIENLSAWVYEEGGVFLGINEPSASGSCQNEFALANILGINKDTGARICHGKWNYTVENVSGLIPKGAYIKSNQGIYITSEETTVLMEENGIPVVTLKSFGKGKGVYFSSFRRTMENQRMLQNLILYASDEALVQNGTTNSCKVECAWYPESGKYVLINSSAAEEEIGVNIEGKSYLHRLSPYEMEIYCISQ